MDTQTETQPVAPPELPSAVISSPEITRQVERILRSPVFLKAVRSQRFLRYLAAAAVAEPPITVKEYTVALDVFDRDAYDPAIDATVRVEASRLRSRLREYYDTAGNEDQLLIQIPKGAYQLTATRRAAPRPRPPPRCFPPLLLLPPPFRFTLRRCRPLRSPIPLLAPSLAGRSSSSLPFRVARWPPGSLTVISSHRRRQSAPSPSSP